MNRAWMASLACAGFSLGAVPCAAQVMAASFVSDPLPVAERVASSAGDTRTYKRDAARHVYASFAPRIYKGMLPPLIHAIVVVETELDAEGRVVDINMVRVPTHAPDVTAAVRQMIRSVSPMPAPARLGRVKFTEIWLVDKSGRFQLDTLTEGQR